MLKKVWFTLEVIDALCFVMNWDTAGNIVTVLTILVMFLSMKQPITITSSDECEYVMA